MAIALLDAFQNPSFAPAAGSNRLAIVFFACEHNAAPPTIASPTLGGQPLVSIGGITNFATFGNRIEAWYLNEAGIVAMSGTTLVPDWSTTPVGSENYEIGVLSGVDQTTPIGNVDTGSASSANAVSLTTGIAVDAGNWAVCGVDNGSQRNWSAPTGYTNHVQIAGTSENLAASTKAIVGSGTEDPSATCDGSPANRLVMVGFEVSPASTPSVPTDHVLQTGVDWGASPGGRLNGALVV